MDMEMERETILGLSQTLNDRLINIKTLLDSAFDSFSVPEGEVKDKINQGNVLVDIEDNLRLGVQKAQMLHDYIQEVINRIH